MPGRGDRQGTADGAEQWVELNAKYAAIWPNITDTKPPPADAEDFNGVADKFETEFSPNPATEPVS